MQRGRHARSSPEALLLLGGLTILVRM